MKLIRFESEEGGIFHGAIDAPDASEARLIEGDFPADFSVTTELRSIKKLLAPILPPNILALGLNYRKHADETGIACPDIPVVFLKATSSVIGPDEPIVLPAAGPDEVDYEVELAIVIAKPAKNVAVDRAGDHILGYTCANDVSARDWQIKKQKKQWARGKSFDTFCPIGPWIVTKDELRDPDNVRVQTKINGELFQDSSTSDMIFGTAAIVSHLSQSMTLLPGTLILTGTPEGVGFTRNPPRFLREGDEVSVIIEHIGELNNPVVRE
ncbi:MAG: fumarylacetoacetate hydrolase family protein [Pseudomonadota bacterium]